MVSAVNSFTFVKTVHIVCDTLRFEMDAAENIFTLLERFSAHLGRWLPAHSSRTSAWNEGLWALWAGAATQEESARRKGQPCETRASHRNKLAVTSTTRNNIRSNIQSNKPSNIDDIVFVTTQRAAAPHRFAPTPRTHPQTKCPRPHTLPASTRLRSIP